MSFSLNTIIWMIWIVGSVLSALTQSVNELHVDSAITKVTVYNDRSLVTRTASIPCGVGEYTLWFDLLPSNLEKQSLQVSSSSSDCILKNVQFHKQALEADPEAKRAEIQREIDDVMLKIGTIKDAIDAENEQRHLLQAMIDKATYPNSKTDNLVGDVDLKRWTQLMHFQRTTLQNITAEIRKDNQLLKVLEKRLQYLQSLLRDPSESEAFSKGSDRESAVVTVQTAHGGILTLNIAYVVFGTRWEPIYDVRVNTEDKTIALAYHGMVSQSTGEDWANVQLELSTARPQFGGVQPELTPWRLNERQSFLQRPTYGAHFLAMKLTPRHSAAETQDVNVSEEQAMVGAAPPMAAMAAGVTSRTTSVSFGISGKHSVKSDNMPVKVMIAQQQLPAVFRYSAVPKLVERVYFKAKITNSADYPLLAGNANVFVDNNYVSNTFLNTIGTTEETWISLGTDEGIVVKYKFVKRHESSEGWSLLSKERRRVRFEYQIDVQNNKKTPEEVVIWDQIPISQNKDIVVELLEPHYERDTDSLKKTDLNYLEWFYTLSAGEKAKISLRYSVEFPKEMQIDGL